MPTHSIESSGARQDTVNQAWKICEISLAHGSIGFVAVKTKMPPDATSPGVNVRRFGKGTGVAFAWQEKKALDAIRAKFDGNSLSAVALAVYLALSEIASDNQTESIETTLAWIAMKAATSVASVKRIIPGLESINVLTVDRRKLNGPSVYCLLPVQIEPPAGQLEPPAAQIRNKPSRAALEECTEQIKIKGEQAPRLYPREAEAIVKAATKEIKAIENDDANWDLELAPEIQENTL